MQHSSSTVRLAGLPTAVVGGVGVPVATGTRARLLGLAHLDREEAGPGLLIPRCRSVHTFGMRFDLDVLFLDRDLEPVQLRRGVKPRRVVWAQRPAFAALEVPAGGGDIAWPSPV
jgi:uncharacterized membrane protein (UPF0127 family)